MTALRLAVEATTSGFSERQNCSHSVCLSARLPDGSRLETASDSDLGRAGCGSRSADAGTGGADEQCARNQEGCTQREEGEVPPQGATKIVTNVVDPQQVVVHQSFDEIEGAPPREHRT